MDQLCTLSMTATNAQTSRNGGLLGLASAAIGLGSAYIPYLDRIIPMVLTCLGDSESRIRYFGVECIVSERRTRL